MSSTETLKHYAHLALGIGLTELDRLYSEAHGRKAADEAFRAWWVTQEQYVTYTPADVRWAELLVELANQDR
jgi:hypothetical protein